MKRTISLSAFALAIAALAGCGESRGQESRPQDRKPMPAWQGMWQGRGRTFEKVMDDSFRKLSRQSECDFWFVADAGGKIHGECFVSYEANLKALKWKVPLPTGGTIDAEVGGSAPKMTFRIGITGTVTDKFTGRDHGNHENCDFEIDLQATGDKDGKETAENDGVVPGVTFKFTIDASVSVPAPGAGAAPAPHSPQILSIPIDAKGWSPFQGIKVQATRAPGEPSRAMAEKKDAKYYILWYAIQQMR